MKIKTFPAFHYLKPRMFAWVVTLFLLAFILFKIWTAM
jgi:hypothetical protein